MQLIRTGYVTRREHETGTLGHRVMATLGTFASNVVDRFHEYADARLAQELTIVEQRRRLLDGRNPNRTPRTGRLSGVARSVSTADGQGMSSSARMIANCPVDGSATVI